MWSGLFKFAHGRIQREGGGTGGLDPPATKPALNVGPASAPPLPLAKRHSWWNLDPLSSHQLTKKKKKRYQMWTPSDKTFWIRACQSTIFRYVWTGLPGLNQHQAGINVSCSRTQCSATTELYWNTLTIELFWNTSRTLI